MVYVNVTQLIDDMGMSSENFSCSPRHTCAGLLQSIVEYQGVNHCKLCDN